MSLNQVTRNNPHTKQRARLIAAGLATVTAAGIAMSGGGDPVIRSATPTEVSFHAESISAKFDHRADEIKRGRKVARAAHAAGFRGHDLRVAIAIAGAESRWRSIDNRGVNRDGSVDYGEWQINKSAHPKLFKSRNWKNVNDNARMARSIAKESKARGNNPFRPWSTYNSGAYRAWMADADVLAREVER